MCAQRGEARGCATSECGHPAREDERERARADRDLVQGCHKEADHHDLVQGCQEIADHDGPCAMMRGR